MMRGLLYGWHGNVEKLTERNRYFRKVLFTGKHEQVVLMALGPGEEIGNEVHHDTDQFFRVESGRAQFVVANGKKRFAVGSGGAVVIPAGTYHNVKNVSKLPLKLYTIYAPPEHPAGTIDKTKADAIRRGD